MATITEDYVSFETAKLLKRKGFDEQTVRCYDLKKKLCVCQCFGNETINSTPNYLIAAPTLQMVMKWLREEYNIDILITIGGFIEKGKVYFCSVYKNLIKYGDLKECLTYEQACEEAILYCLTNLI